MNPWTIFRTGTYLSVYGEHRYLNTFTDSIINFSNWWPLHWNGYATNNGIWLSL